MKKTIWKLYWNPDKEQTWLNQMAARGLALSDYSWARYVFEETEPGTYIYQLDLLEKKPGHPESEVYLRFLEDSGIEVVATYMRWVYLRKKAADGVFAVYSDNESRLRYLKRLKNFWLVLMLMELIIGFINIFMGFADAFIGGRPDYNLISWMNVFTGSLCAGIGFMILIFLFRPVYLQIKKLMKEKNIRD